jgi:molecular chaperone GrpE
MAEAHQDEAVQAERDRLRDELRREHDALLRSLADFENYRRRVEREQGDAARRGKRELILPLLDLLDDFDRALAHIDDAPPAIAQGLSAVQRKLVGLLTAAGVSRFESIGERFDPRFHEAIATVSTNEVPSGNVADVLQHGYVWNDEVLRPARVRVAE